MGWELPPAPDNLLTQTEYLRPIYSAIDTETGEPLSSFELFSVNGVNPPGNIAILPDELPTLGVVTYP